MLYNNMKRICHEKKISVSKIESELEFSRGSICKWNDNIPSVDKVKKVADYLGVDINELIGGSEPKAG